MRSIQSADSSGFRILNMFDWESWLTITESVVESANSTAKSAADPIKIGLLCSDHLYVHS